MFDGSPGILVPKATNTMAVTESLIPNVQPKWDATSPIMAVTIPIQRMEITKHKYPPAMSIWGERGRDVDQKFETVEIRKSHAAAAASNIFSIFFSSALKPKKEECWF
jgi:hypothetical protein